MNIQHETAQSWFVYIILCSDQSLYTGITNQVDRRFKQHQGLNRGAKYFNGRQPIRMIYLEAGHTRSSAAKREYQIKKLRRVKKLQLIGSSTNSLGVSGL